jgi:hypothetical protein
LSRCQDGGGVCVALNRTDCAPAEKQAAKDAASGAGKQGKLSKRAFDISHVMH